MESNKGDEANSYADANRLRKVLQLIEVFRLAKFTADQVAAMTSDQWRLAALCAGVTNPSEITIDLVIHTMRDYEQLPKRKVNAAQARSILGQITKPLDKIRKELGHKSKASKKGKRK